MSLHERTDTLPTTINLWLIVAAIALYASISSPFPRAPGVPEAVVGGLLVVSVGLRGLAWLLGPCVGSRRAGIVAPLAFYYLLIVPTLWGLVRGWAVVDMIRDFVPMLYLFIPVIFSGVVAPEKRAKWAAVLPWAVSMCGVTFSVRYFNASGGSVAEVGQTLLVDNLAYYPYDPSVSFGAVFLALQAVLPSTDRLHGWSGAQIFRWMRRILCLLGSGLCFAALAGVAQRAPIGLGVAAVLWTSFSRMRQRPFLALLGVIGLVAIVYVFADQLDLIAQMLLRKQQELGSNNKIDEARSVLKSISRGLGIFLLGAGFGGLFPDPAVMGMRVSFTHSLLSYLLLKTGILGFLAGMGYLLPHMKRLMLGCWSGNTALVACMPAIAVGLLFQASYKCFSFGLLLLIVQFTVLSPRHVLAEQRSGHVVFPARARRSWRLGSRAHEQAR